MGKGEVGLAVWCVPTDCSEAKELSRAANSGEGGGDVVLMSLRVFACFFNVLHPNNMYGEWDVAQVVGRLPVKVSIIRSILPSMCYFPFQTVVHN